MGASVLLINGATREGGNTDAVLQSFAEGAREAGLDVRVAVLRDLRIADCIGCCQCLREGTCSIDDDMSGLREAIEGADVLVLASPIYWCEVTGLLKTCIDRFYIYHHERNRHRVEGKRAVTLTTLGEAGVEYEASVLVEFYRRLLASLRIELTDSLFFPALMERRDIEAHPEYREQAFQPGRRLQGLSPGP